MSYAVDLLVLDFCSRGRCSLAIWKSLLMQYAFVSPTLTSDHAPCVKRVNCIDRQASQI